MSDFPFGFNLPSEGDDPDQRGDRPPGADPFAALFGGDPNAIGPALQRLGQVLSYEGGPVNWDLAEEVARQTVTAEGDASVSVSDTEEVTAAVRLAEVWLDAVTALPAGATSAAAWSRSEWVVATLPVWRQLADPIAVRVVAAMGESFPAEMRPMAGPMIGMLTKMGGAMFGAQLGQALGSLAGEVVSSTDIGLPLGPAGRAALLPANVADFGAGLGVPADQVRLFLALREAAHHRLFAHVPWLRGHLLAAVESYARGIAIDTARLEEAARGIDPTNPQAFQEALQSGVFEPRNTPEQDAALVRLETALALVEGWVDDVVADAAAERLPSSAALRETVRRRRASGGPAEETFASLVGLELRPRRAREAAALWQRLKEERGVPGRDALWAHPDLLPDADALEDPEGFLSRDDAIDLTALDDGAGEPPEDS